MAVENPKPLTAATIAAQTLTIAANTKSGVPQLGNTEQDDRPLLREISDRHVHPANSLPTSGSNATSASVNRDKSSAQETASAWALVQQSTRMQIPNHELVSFYREQYRQEAIWVTRMLNRATPFVGYIVDELDKRFLPVELALLPAIESAYRADVHSPKDAVGIWQIIPATAADMGIQRTSWFDGRSDIQQSTRAATNYLSYLNAEFHGDWLLTLAAYNAGLGRVRSAIKRNSHAGLPIDFWSLKLPRETRHYVPKFLALIAMLRHDQPAGLTIPAVPRGSAFDVVDARQRVGLSRLTRLTGLPELQVRQLNAALIRGITPPQGPHLLYVPQGFGGPLIEALINDTDVAQNQNTGTHRVNAGEASSQYVEYVVSIGDTLSDIAKRFSVPVSSIRNELGQTLTSDIIHPGEKLSLRAPAR